jgi:hypothetical protein
VGEDSGRIQFRQRRRYRCHEGNEQERDQRAAKTAGNGDLLNPKLVKERGLSFLGEMLTRPAYCPADGLM